MLCLIICVVLIDKLTIYTSDHLWRDCVSDGLILLLFSPPVDGRGQSGH